MFPSRRRGQRGGLLKILGVLLLLTLLCAGGLAAYVTSQVNDFLDTAPSATHDDRIVTIPRGAGPSKVSNLLAEAGVITDAKKFSLYIRKERAAPGLRAGEFRFFTDMTPERVLRTLLKATEVTYPLTLPEGLRIEEMARKVEAAGFGEASRYIELAHDEGYIAGLDLPIEPPPLTLEGILIPETYSLPAGATVEDVLTAQVQRFKAIWDERRLARAKEIGMSPYEVVVLASVVEKETGVPEERPHIAGVFHHRLRIGMPLQSDPTIIYGLKDYKGNIRRKDIRKKHPWNTYVIPGLPPTPIAGVGVAAIDATLWPLDTKDLYFVATGGGRHDFSSTLREHNSKVQHYQVRGKKSPWRRR